MVAEVIDSMAVKEREVRARDGRWLLLRVRPYRTIENRIDGATMVFLDIDALKKSQQAEAIVETMRHPLLVLDGKLRVKSANPAFYRLFETVEKDTIGKPIYELDGGQWNSPALRGLLEDVLPKKATVEDFKIEHSFGRLGRRAMLVNARQLKAEHDEDQLILVAMELVAVGSEPQ
jgi:two-component system CheB/CheR fusion protein